LNGFGADPPGAVEASDARATTPGTIDSAAAATVPFMNSRLCIPDAPMWGQFSRRSNDGARMTRI
jgi:hypothetical protein